MLRASVFSIFIHLMILFFISYQAMNHYSLPNHTGNVVQAYLLEKTGLISEQDNKKIIESLSFSDSLDEFREIKLDSPIKYPLEHRPANRIVKQDNVEASKSQQGEYDELLIALHNRVQHQVVYPRNIPAFIRQATMTVSFLLLPTGSIKQVDILQSSGIAAIDRQVIASLQAINDFKLAEHYLDTPKYFNLQFIFKR